MSGVSQINYWRESKKPDTNKTNTEAGPGAAYLSYDVFMGLSVLGGLLALDHLYLRSPLTFLAKIIVNILTLGSWWLYDASQAVFNKDVVKVFGLGIPGFGPKGIGAGVLASDVPDKKHMSFFIYGLALILGGIFGLDSFIVGDKQSGFIRLVCLITGILAPVALFWWLFNLGKFFFKTKDVTSLHWEYFGAPPPPEHGMTVGEKIVTRFPFLQTIFGPIKRAKNEVVSIAKNVIESPVEIPLKIAKDTITTAIADAKPEINAALAPLTSAIQPLANTIDTGLETVKEGIQLGEDVAGVASKALNVAGETAQAATSALKIVPEAAALSSGFTPSAAQAALSTLEQKGGGSSSLLPYMVIGTFGLIAVSGFVMTYRRSKKNERNEPNDSPPEPGVLRESNKEKST
jgi:hypothetical protein